MKETQSESPVSDKNKSEDIIIYAVDISIGLKGIDRYSTEAENEILKSTYAFDNSCVYFDKENNSITLEELADIVNGKYADSLDRTRLRLVKNGKLIKEVHIIK